MAAISIMKLLLFVYSIANIVCDQTNEQWNSNQFDNELLRGPPHTQRQMFDLKPESKTGEVIVFNDSVRARDDYQACITFDYYLNVPDHAKWGLRLVLTDDKTRANRTVWARYGFTVDVWKTAKIKTNVTKGQYFQFQAQTTDGTIAFTPIIYDVSFYECQFSDSNTDFEGDFNTWDGESGVMNRLKMNGRDHTSSSEVGKVGVIRYNKRIYPLKMVKNRAECMSFWYYQMSNGSARFHVADSGSILWRGALQPAQLDKWVHVQIPIRLQFIESYVAIEADTKDGDPGTVILIDDVEFTEKKCPEPIDCNFAEGTTCGWNDVYYSQAGLRWHIGKGRVSGTSYLSDNLKVPIHKENTLYTDFTRHIPNNVPVELRSPFFPDSGEYCATIHFLYNKIQVSDTFSLNYYIETKSVCNKQELWKLDSYRAFRKSQASDYIEEIVDVQIPASTFPRKIALSAISSYPTSRMAVQSIKVTPGKCQSQQNPTQTPAPKPTPKPTPIPTPTPSANSKLPREILIVSSQMLKSSRGNIQQILQMIKIDDPIKDLCQKLVRELDSAIQQVEQNIK